MGADTEAYPSEVLDGAAIYHGRTLRRYDRVLFVNAGFFWRCPRREILRRYRAAVGTRHLEIGVGTGFCPAHTRFPGPDPEITLVDLNPQALRFTADRLSQHRPRTVRANALEPLADAGVPVRTFDSVALNLVLHCVPGDLFAKSAVLANAAVAARPGGTVVGSTVLAQGVPVSRAGRWLMARKNAAGIFHNAEDRLEDLRKLLTEHFADHTLTVRGCMALFTATAR